MLDEIEMNELLLNEHLKRIHSVPLEFGVTQDRYAMQLERPERDYARFRYRTAPVLYMAPGGSSDMSITTFVDAFSLDRRHDLQTSPVACFYNASSTYYSKEEGLKAVHDGVVPDTFMLPPTVASGTTRKENMFEIQDILVKYRKKLRDPFLYTVMHGFVLHEEAARSTDAAVIPSEACIGVKYKGKRVLFQFNSLLHKSMGDKTLSPYLKTHMTNHRFVQYFASGIADAIVFQTIPLNAETSLTHKLFTSPVFAHFAPRPIHNGQRTLYGVCANSATAELQHDEQFMKMALEITDVWEENFQHGMQLYREGIAPVNKTDQAGLIEAALARQNMLYMRHARQDQGSSTDVTMYDYWEECGYDPVTEPSIQFATATQFLLNRTDPTYRASPL